MANYVLLHGAWHGAWCWERVAQRLTEAGHTVHLLTFSGTGERAHLLDLRPRPKIGFRTHIQDITQFVQMQDLHDLTIVAHSYAGLPLCGAFATIAAHVRHLVYMDAFVPIPGRTRVGDLLRVKHPPLWLQPWVTEMLVQMTRSQPVPPPPLRFLGVSDPADHAWVQSHLTPMPLRFLDGLETLETPPDSLMSYIWCAGSGDAMGEGFAPFALYGRQRGWRSFTIDTGHDAMITAPEEVARILITIAAPVAVKERA